MSQIKLLITDFDGTLVDTFEANYRAYRKAFAEYGIELTRDEYASCFGFRFDDFMAHVGIYDESIKKEIRTLKSDFYPLFFDKLVINESLLSLIRAFKHNGGLTALASTARRKNLMNVLDYIHVKELFSLILAGEDVVYGKPNPEIYNTVLKKLRISPDEALVFEDSLVGITAAKDAGISYIQITNSFFVDEYEE